MSQLHFTEEGFVPPLHPIERKKSALDGGPGLKGLGKIKSTLTQRSTTPTRAKTARFGDPGTRWAILFRAYGARDSVFQTATVPPAAFR